MGSFTLQCIADFKEHNDYVVSVDISLDGKIGVSGGYNDTVFVWDIRGRKVVQSIDGAAAMGFGIKLSVDKKVLYTCGGYVDRTIQVWDLDSAKCIETLIGHEYAIDCLEITHDGKFLVSASMDKTIKVWDLYSHKCIKTITGHVGPILSLKITPDLKYIISGGGGKYDNTVRVWNICRSKLPSDAQIPSKNISKIQYSIPGKYILNLSRKGIQLRDHQTGLIKTELKGHKAYIKQVWINPEGNMIISASLDRTIMIWNPGTSSPSSILKGHTEGILDISISKDQKRLVSTGWGGQIIEWNLDQNKERVRYHGHSECIEFVSYIHGDEYVLSIDSNSNLKIWNLVTDECMITLSFPELISSNIILDGLDNLHLGFMDGSVQYWDMLEHKMLLNFIGHTELVSCLELVEAEQIIYSGSLDCTIREWDINTGDCIGIFEGHTGEITFIRKIPGQNRIITASRDHTIRVWEVNTGKCVAVLTTNLLITSLSEVQNSGQFAYGTMQGEFKVIDIS